jgi:hypothetical protein
MPTHLRLLHGTPDRRPLPVAEPLGVGVLRAPPDWFDDEQRAQWHYAIENAPPGLLTATDREVLIIWTGASVEHARAAECASSAKSSRPRTATRSRTRSCRWSIGKR